MMHYHMGWIDEHGQPLQSGGGKRIRPMLTLLVSEAVSGSYEPARAPAAAVELIHNFSLLHDDIQDGSPLRRKRPTAWKIWGTAQGINAGDSMFALAHLAIPRLGGSLDNGVLITLLRLLDETCIELTRGQHLDMLFETRDGVSIAEYLDMIAGKTAALIAAAARMGALAAGAGEDVQEHYRAFGHHLGLAFQVLDDVLDIWGEPSVTGKEAAVDIRQRKKSLPVLYGIEHSPGLQALYADLQPMTDERVHTAISLLDSVSARDYAESLARDYSAKTLSHLEAANPQGSAGETLYALVDFLLKRSF
jgi:geranylgeranyl diphosphate synthase type I